MEIENNRLDEVLQNSINDLDFDSFQKDLSLDFDLPLSDCEKLEIFEIEQNENVEFFNSNLEKDFNEHEFFGLYEDELPNEEEVDSRHEFENFNFEKISNELEIVSVEKTLSIEKCYHIVLNTTQMSNFTEFTYDHKVLKNYTDKFVEYMNYFWNAGLVEKTSG